MEKKYVRMVLSRGAQALVTFEKFPSGRWEPVQVTFNADGRGLDSTDLRQLSLSRAHARLPLPIPHGPTETEVR